MIVYKITNSVNGKIYIGQYCRKDPNYLGSGVLIKKAIKKYGRENFKKEILEKCESKQQLNEREIYWIGHYNSTDKDIGYNITVGGDRSWLGLHHTEESKRKISEAKKNPSEETRNKIRLANLGRKVSEETRMKKRLAMKGKKLGPFSEEHRKNIGLAAKGRKASNETKLKMSVASKGRKHTEETKRKMSEPHTGKKLSQEHIEKVRQFNLGKKHTEDHKRKIGLAGLGRKHTEDSKLRISRANMGNKYALGAKRSEETIIKMRRAAKIREAAKREARGSI